MFRKFDLKAPAGLFVMGIGLGCLQPESASAQTTAPNRPVIRSRIPPSPYEPGALPSLIDPATGQLRELTPPPVETPWPAPPARPYAPPPAINPSGGLAGPAPDWVARPQPDDYARYYPAYAQYAGYPGRALISCIVTADGRLEQCFVRWEKPEAYGFGEAALRLSRLFRTTTIDRQGRSMVGKIINVPIIFQIPDPLSN